MSKNRWTSFMDVPLQLLSNDLIVMHKFENICFNHFSLGLKWTWPKSFGAQRGEFFLNWLLLGLRFYIHYTLESIQYSNFKLVIKVQLFWEGCKNLEQSSSRFWHYLVTSKPWAQLHQIFVAILEKLNFNTQVQCWPRIKNWH